MADAVRRGAEARRKRDQIAKPKIKSQSERQEEAKESKARKASKKS
jgi:hypothetical protein